MILLYDILFSSLNLNLSYTNGKEILCVLLITIYII